MNTTKENNIKILLIWLGFLLITVGLGVCVSFCLDNGAIWQAIAGLAAFVILIFGTVKFGQWVRAYYVNLDSQEALKQK